VTFFCLRFLIPSTGISFDTHTPQHGRTMYHHTDLFGINVSYTIPLPSENGIGLCLALFSTTQKHNMFSHSTSPVYLVQGTSGRYEHGQ
jgi:hypothetical protein